MIRLRPAAARGRFRNDWLDARFSFSFGDYRDPAFDGYGDLWVLNDDRVAPGAGFTAHPHSDVEVMSYPLSGVIEHRDSLGNRALMRPGDVHLMRAGTGIVHSEMNASADEPEQHLQWWIRPARRGLSPAYARLSLDPADMHDRLRLIGSPDGAASSLLIAQDLRVWAGRVIEHGFSHALPLHRRAYLHVARGALVVNGLQLADGDGAFVESESQLRFAPAGRTAELLLFDLRGK
jgi:redox-sensitive bicupin YhaK (pirin superfamily)